MAEVGIRALKQNASAVVARASAGETITVTDRGRPVAVLAPLPSAPLQALVAAGRARLPLRSLRDLPAPEPGADVSAVLAAMRADERY